MKSSSSSQAMYTRRQRAQQNLAAVEPYRFEPERASEENQAPDREDDNDEPEILVNVNWCTCGRCDIRETVR